MATLTANRPLESHPFAQWLGPVGRLPARLRRVTAGTSLARWRCAGPSPRRGAAIPASRVGGLALFVTLAALPAAWAQPAGSAGCESKPACLLLYEEAQQHSKRGDFAAAARSYGLAYEVLPDPRLLFSLGRVLHKGGQLAPARDAYQRFLAAHVDDATQNQKAVEHVRQIDQQLQPAAPTADTMLAPTGQASSSRPTEATPVYKKAWFWVVIGGTAAAVGLGVGLGVALGGRAATDNITNTYAPSF